MSEWISHFAALPAYGIGGIVVLVLYMLQAELRFGSRARAHVAGASDRNSTWALSAAALVPTLGLALALKATSPASRLPLWFREAVLPGLPAVAWMGVALGVIGLGVRLVAVLRLRERYTRTLLVRETHTVERNGIYRWVRHPGYLGSLLCLNGIALASGNWMILIASLPVTAVGYGYRIKVEDEMLVGALGAEYATYREEVRALLPFARQRSTRRE
jgi:protein-S-isoprenylcysteine O-methyltransferase